MEELFQWRQAHAPDVQLVLVMDRWFASDRLFKLFQRYSVYFIARSKGNKLVQLPWDQVGGKKPLGDISQTEIGVIRYRTHSLRFIRSDYKNGMKGGEPWFLLTVNELTHGDNQTADSQSLR